MSKIKKGITFIVLLITSICFSQKDSISFKNYNESQEWIEKVRLLSDIDKKNEILDNEHDCKYQLNFQKAILTVTSQQKGCERFVGNYRLYD